MGDHRTVTKKQLVNRLAERTGQTKVVVKEVVQSFLNEIIDELARGNRLEFREFGVFEVRERAARRAQNPRTLEKVDVPKKRVVRFKVGRRMRERICEQEAPQRQAAPVQPAPAATTPPVEQAPPASAPPPPAAPGTSSPF
jgi:nucleoid DNA-binding protein